MIEVKICKAQGIKISSNSSKKPEDYIDRILEINSYLGTICLIELKLLDPEQVISGREKLIELTEKYPTYPHAFIRLWMHDFNNGHYSHSLNAIEPLYANFSEFNTVPEMDVMVVNLYAQSLFKEKHYIKCFEILQEAF